MGRGKKEQCLLVRRCFPVSFSNWDAQVLSSACLIRLRTVVCFIYTTDTLYKAGDVFLVILRDALKFCNKNRLEDTYMEDSDGWSTCGRGGGGELQGRRRGAGGGCNSGRLTGQLFRVNVYTALPSARSGQEFQCFTII